jgi:hypothetical protein
MPDVLPRHEQPLAGLGVEAAPNESDKGRLREG